MAQYTVRDNATKKTITFEWEGDAAPTDADMVEVFAAARQSAPKPAPKSYTPAETERLRREFVAKEGTAATRVKEALPSRKQVADFVRPTLEGVGAGLGTLAGAGGGTLAGLATGPAAPGAVPVAAVGGGVLGGTLGYAAGKYVADAIEGAPQSAGQTLRDLKTGAMYEMGGAGAGAALGSVMRATGKTVKPSAVSPNPKAVALGLSELADGQRAPKLETIIDKGIEKGIRPSVVGNRTFKQSEQYRSKAQQAVKTIVENKNVLKLTDEFGEATQGLPKNLRQFSQAIDQTKGGIYKQYNEMATAAGEAGAKVDLGPIPTELMKVANNKSLQLAAPDAAAYARKRAEAFNNVGAATDGVTTTRNNYLAAEQAQEVISMYNQSLDAFYKNPSYDTASKAYIDSLIVNNLRKGLDDVIEKAVGPGYQDLKRAYGALKAIEKDVAHRAVIDARKNVKGLVDFSDIFSGGQVVGGLMSMNPATVGTGIASKMIANLYKIKNDPNRIIANMFKQVDKRYKPTPQAKNAPPTQAAKVQEPNPMAGKVNTGGIVQPGPKVNTMGPVNTAGIVQPGPIINQMGPVNVGGIVQPGPAINRMGPINTMNLPRGEGLVYDPSTGRMINRKQ